jgi:hypothetical protein
MAHFGDTRAVFGNDNRYEAWVARATNFLQNWGEATTIGAQPLEEHRWSFGVSFGG